MDMPTIVEFGSSACWLIVYFLGFLFLFHAWLVFWKPIGELGWKYVDYFWLLFALVGVVGQAAQIRQQWYSSAHEISNFRVASTLMSLKRTANLSIGSAVCRTFTRSEASPKDLERVQAEYNLACSEFSRLTKEIIANSDSRDVAYLDMMDVSQTRAKLSDPTLVKILQSLESDHRAFVTALKERAEARHRAGRTSTEAVLVIFSPFLFLLALALRITKVTGEIRLKIPRPTR
jgi:hypothetical protein